MCKLHRSKVTDQMLLKKTITTYSHAEVSKICLASTALVSLSHADQASSEQG